jgi:phage-related baseplate assembly protein
MAVPSLASLLVQQTQAAIYAAALSIATTLGLPVTSWQPGDPTRSLFFIESTFLQTLENIVVGYIQSGFLDYASGQWLQILAWEVYGVEVPQATYAETQIVLTNSGGGVYEIAPGDLVVSSSASGATYTNTTGGTITGVGTAGATLTLTVVADQAGSASTASATAINTMVTTYGGVTCSNPAAAIGTDAQDDATTRQQCRNKLGSLSPNGPAAAYAYVALNQTLTGIQTVTRARVYPDSETGDVQVYVAGPSGAVASGDVTAVQNAINTWATPLCITPTVTSANPVTVAVTYTLWIYQSVNQTTSQIEAAVQTVLENLFASRPIGGDIIPPATTGSLDASLIESTILAVFPQGFKLTLSLPSADVALGNGDVAELGTVTPTINIVTGG